MTMATFSVLINGRTIGFFKSTRGLREGDPISPYLFVMVMGPLSWMIKKAENGGYIENWKIDERGIEVKEVKHPLFSVGTLLFCQPLENHKTYLSWLLM